MLKPTSSKSLFKGRFPLSLFLLTFLMAFMMQTLLLAGESKNNNTTTSKYGYTDKKSDDDEKDKAKEEKKAEKEQKKAAKQQVKAEKKNQKSEKPSSYRKDEKPVKHDNATYSSHSDYAGDKDETKVKVHQNNTSVEQHNYTPSNNTVQQHNYSQSNNTVQQGQGQHVITPGHSNQVEQHGGGHITPEPPTTHNGGNHSPNEPDWTQPYHNNNHSHIGHGGYYHDDYQHYFHVRRHHWHERNSFFTFRLRFENDPYFPYNDLYYYPTDYVVVDSRLSVIVLPFTYRNDSYRVNDDITEQLMSELRALRRFNVIEESTVDRIMSRNDIRPSDLVEEYPAKRIGRIAGADLVIMGTIDRASDHYTLSVKCIDPDTGETVITETATSDYTDNRNIERLVKYLAVLIYNDVPLAEGNITDVDYNEVELNIGTDDGLAEGMRLVVYRDGPDVRHPYTGEYLGQRVKKVAEVYVVDVTDSNATAKILSKNGKIRIGDRVIVK